ncbi:his operon leader peptide [Escherichia coli]|nr:his operon leader peptide [Escherichia coli]
MTRVQFKHHHHHPSSD